MLLNDRVIAQRNLKYADVDVTQKILLGMSHPNPNDNNDKNPIKPIFVLSVICQRNENGRVRTIRNVSVLDAENNSGNISRRKMIEIDAHVEALTFQCLTKYDIQNKEVTNEAKKYETSE